MDYKEAYDYFHKHFSKVMDYCGKNRITYSIEPALEEGEGFVVEFKNWNRESTSARIIPKWITTTDHVTRFNDTIIRILKINLK